MKTRVLPRIAAIVLACAMCCITGCGHSSGTPPIPPALAQQMQSRVPPAAPGVVTHPSAQLPPGVPRLTVPARANMGR